MGRERIKEEERRREEKGGRIPGWQLYKHKRKETCSTSQRIHREQDAKSLSFYSAFLPYTPLSTAHIFQLTVPSGERMGQCVYVQRCGEYEPTCAYV